MADIQKITDEIVIQGEGRWFEFVYTQRDGSPLPMPDTGYTFIVKQTEGAEEILFTGDNFNTTGKDNGIILVNLPASDSINLPAGWLFGQMTAVISADTDVDIKKIKFKVEADL